MRFHFGHESNTGESYTQEDEMYTTINFKSKKDLKAALAAGKKITVQPNDTRFFPSPTDGHIYLEGPHYQQPHKWFAQAELKDGFVISVK